MHEARFPVCYVWFVGLTVRRAKSSWGIGFTEALSGSGIRKFRLWDFRVSGKGLVGFRVIRYRVLVAEWIHFRLFGIISPAI